jgi:hypothetical protein
MKLAFCCGFAIVLLCLAASAQQAPVNSPLLDHLTGTWVLQGTIAGQQVTHDVTADWVLVHHHVRIHEISREKVDGNPRYEAMVFVGLNDQMKQYTCAWLDVYGGAGIGSIGVAQMKDAEIPFVFKDEKGITNFTNDFVYDAKSDTWTWIMDNVDNGVAKPFARLKLTRASAATTQPRVQ